jgi:hypothetical protein
VRRGFYIVDPSQALAKIAKALSQTDVRTMLFVPSQLIHNSIVTEGARSSFRTGSANKPRQR